MTKIRHFTTPFTLKDLTLKNRIVMPPMCQYQAVDGIPNDWHLVHYTSRAVGGVGLIIMEMTNILPNGRISPNCLGLWNDEQRDQFKKIVDLVHANGSKIAIQIAHAGRKALGESDVVSSSDIIYDGIIEASSRESKWLYKKPRALSKDEILNYIQLFQNSAKRAVEAGFDAIELHGAHGYLIHQFYSPKSNIRTDEYGKDKMLFGEQVIKAVKAVMPSGMPLLMRISAQEYGDDGFDLSYGCEVAKRFANAGVDIIDVSGGGDGKINTNHTPTFNAGYQVFLAEAVKNTTGLPVIAVGMLESPPLADYILGSTNIDLVAIGRGLLRDPYWLLNAQYHQATKDNNEISFIPDSYRGAFI